VRLVVAQLADHGAAAEVRMLRGAPAASCAGWLAEAEDRLLFDQTLCAAKAQAAIRAAAMC